LVRTLADTRDTLALGALLRGPLVGLTEQELLDITGSLPPSDAGHESVGLSLRISPEAIQHEVAREVLTVLRDLQRRVHGTAPALLLAEAIERLRVRAIIMGRSADQAVRSLANIDGLLERARSYGVRGFVQFAKDIDEEWSSGAGHAEGMVEADGQSIEIVTVHSSKGLEWPVVIPINRASMPRRAEKFVYRRSDESLHWALGQIIPPSLGDALQSEEIEKRNENLRLLYVACTRAMELLIVPDFSWSNDASWAKLLDFQLGEVPELNIARLPRKPATAADSLENQQSEEIFSAEQSRLVEASPSIRWIRPSDGDPDIVTIQAPSEPGREEPLGSPPTVEGSRSRGVILHKLMEELITGELEENLDATVSRARQLLEQLAVPAHGSTAPYPDELANTALRTLCLPEIEPFRSQLRAEIPIYGTTSAGPNQLIAGRADALANSGDEGVVAFDWKSDVAPKDADRSAYRQQLGQYLHVIGARRGAVVYMTSGEVDWIMTAI
jgi:CRISPR-associated exonuclease Cas4